MIFTIQVNDDVSGLEITNALSFAGIFHTILSKHNDNNTQQNAQTDVCTACDGATVVLSSFGGVEDCCDCGGTGKKQ